MTERTLYTLRPSLVSINWHSTHNLGHWNKEWRRKTDSSLWERYSNTDCSRQRCKCSHFHTRVHIQTLSPVELTNTAASDAHRFLAPRLLSYDSRSCAPWCVYFVVLCLCEDRTGRDKGSPVAVFTANTAEENSCVRWRGRGLMAGAKQPDPSCCEKSPQSQESETERERDIQS